MKFTLISAIWCPSCIIMRPRFYEIAKEKKITLNELDFDDDEKEVDKLNVGSTLPVLIIYDEKGEVCRITGERSKKELEGIFNEKGIF